MRKRKVIGLTIGFASTACIALAAWFALGLIEGTGVTTAGKSTATNIPVKVVVHEGVTPTQEEPIEAVTVENAANPNIVEVKKLTPTITTGNEVACPASNFSIVPTGAEHFEAANFWTGKEYVPHYQNVNPGESMNLVGVGPSKEQANLKMAATAPTGCEGVEVKLKVKIN